MILSTKYTIIDPSLTRAPKKANAIATPREKARQEKKAVATEKGPALWAELHRRALAHEGLDDSAWLEQFAAHLKWCGCMKHWREILAANPPTWGSYFAWTVARHNDVNRRLGKPVLLLEEASRLWAPPTPCGDPECGGNGPCKGRENTRI